MTKTELVIEEVATSLKLGINAGLIRMVLMSEGFTKERIETIMRWGKLKQTNNKENRNA